MPLIFAPIGRELRIVKILTDEKTKKHLESLGITIDSNISIISQSGGSVICHIKINTNLNRYVVAIRQSVFSLKKQRKSIAFPLLLLCAVC